MAIAATGCGPLLRASTAEVISLAYVGNITVGSPQTIGNVTHIPLAFSDGEWLQNSGRVLKELRVRHYASEIHFSAVTCVATSSPPVTPEIVLERLGPERTSFSIGTQTRLAFVLELLKSNKPLQPIARRRAPAKRRRCGPRPLHGVAS